MEQLGSRLGLSRGMTFGLAWTVVLFLVMPIFVVFPVSVTDTRYLGMPEKGVSLQHFAKLATSGDWLGSIWHSITIAGVTTALCVVTGTLCSIGLWRLATRLSEGVRTIMLLPIVIPSIVYSLGVYKLFIDLDLLDSVA